MRGSGVNLLTGHSAWQCLYQYIQTRGKKKQQRDSTGDELEPGMVAPRYGEDGYGGAFGHKETIAGVWLD